MLQNAAQSNAAMYYITIIYSQKENLVKCYIVSKQPSIQKNLMCFLRSVFLLELCYIYMILYFSLDLTRRMRHIYTFKIVYIQNPKADYEHLYSDQQ